MTSKLVKKHPSGEIDEATAGLEALKISDDNTYYILELNMYSLNIL